MLKIESRKRNKARAVSEYHLQNLVLMARSDKVLRKAEIDLIIQIGKERGFTGEEMKQFFENEDLTKQEFIPAQNNYERFLQLYDLTLIMCADGYMDDREVAFLVQYGTKLGLRKTSSAFMALKIESGIKAKLPKEEIYESAKEYMNESLYD